MLLENKHRQQNWNEAINGERQKVISLMGKLQIRILPRVFFFMLLSVYLFFTDDKCGGINDKDRGSSL